MRNRWDDLATELDKAATFARTRAAAAEQRFHDWQRIERISRETRGGGGTPDPYAKEDRQASRQLHQFRLVAGDLENLARRFHQYANTAFPPQNKLEAKHLTVAQVEADNWCGSHWRIGEFVPIAKRPTGEPYYRGRCRDCGKWPGGDPPVEVLQSWRDGRGVKVVAS